MMKVLFVLKDNFPESGACTSLLNNIFFEGGLTEKTASIDVLSVKDKYTAVKSEQYKGVTVHNCVLMSRVSNKQYMRIFFKHPFKVLCGTVRKVISRLKSVDIDRGDVHSIENEMKKLNAQKYDAVVAVMGYFEVALAALQYKQKNPDMKLVLYQVDPCSSNETFSNKTKERRVEFEKKLYEASVSIITTPIIFDEAKALYEKDITEKMVPMEFPNVVPCSGENQANKDDIRCLFTGNIYGEFRNPEYTLKLFDRVEPKISFEIIGSANSKFKEMMKNHKVAYRGSKPLDETKKELASADFLVNIGNGMLNQVPSKLFEYISYGKPIINICKNRNCPTLPYLEKYPYALNLFEEDEIFEKQLKMLNKFISDNHYKRISSDDITRLYEKCTPQYCADQMLGIFKNVNQ